MFQTASEWVCPDGFPNLSNEPEIAIDLETRDPDLKTLGSGWPTRNGNIIGVAVAASGRAWYFPIRHLNGGNMDPKRVMRWVQDLCSDVNKTYVFHNAMYDVGWLRAEGVEVKGRIIDTMVAAALIDENRFSYSLNNLGKDYLSVKKDEKLLYTAANEWGVDAKAEMYKLPPHYVGPYAEQDALLTLKLWELLSGLIEKEEVSDIFELELRVLRSVIDMRTRGVRVNMDAAEQAQQGLKQQESALLKKIKDDYGHSPDIWAAASVAKVFDAAGLEYPVTDGTKAPSFTKEFLAGHSHELPRMIVKARELNKARTTFIETISKHQTNGRIHADIHQLRSDGGGTITGRFCVHGDTVLELDTGPVKIGDYNPTGKEKILTHKGRWQRVLRRIYKGEEEMYCLLASSGDSIKCTGNHRVLTADGWVSVKDLLVGSSLLHVNFKEVSTRRTDVPEDCHNISVGGKTDDIDYRREDWSDKTQCYGSGSETIDSGTTGGRTCVEVFPFKSWGEKPNERQDQGTPPQLQGGFVLRSKWVRPCIEAGLVYWKNVQTYIQAFRGYVRTSWDIWDSGRDRNSSHRWGQDEQRAVQSSLGDIGWSSPFTRTVTVEAIEPVGTASVWDIEVETDHSYIAHGLIHHNSYSSPNLQQIPSRDEIIGPMIRNLFIPEEGCQWGAFDYSSQEPRIVVHYASITRDYDGNILSGALDFVDKYTDDARSDFHQIAADIVGVPRKQAKTINLGLFYGMGVTKLAGQLGLNLAEGKELFARYHAELPFIKQLTDEVSNRASKRGSIRTLLGRKCRFDKWEPASFGVHKPLPHKEAFAEYGSHIKRAFTYKALNSLIQGSAADQTKKALVDLADEGILPMIQIHDELALNIPDMATARRAKEIMENCVQLRVPSVVDAELGPSWGTATNKME
jgi:DNA polymerase I-like protein with 3'-5' exonuclease and polymerase domains